MRRSLEPYADRIAASGLAGISIGPVSHYVGLAAEASGDLTAAAGFQRTAIARNHRDGSRPHEARARRALGRVLRAPGVGDATDRGRPTGGAGDGGVRSESSSERTIGPGEERVFERANDRAR